MLKENFRIIKIIMEVMKMKKIAKIVSTVAAVALLAASFAGCGSKETAQVEKTDGSSFTYWCSLDGNAHHNDRSAEAVSKACHSRCDMPLVVGIHIRNNLAGGIGNLRLVHDAVSAGQHMCTRHISAGIAFEEFLADDLACTKIESKLGVFGQFIDRLTNRNADIFAISALTKDFRRCSIQKNQRL